MVQLTGNNLISTAVFISGRGTNLKSLIKFSKKKNSPINIKLIISNTNKAKGLKYSKVYKIQKKVIDFKNKNIAEKKLLNLLSKKKIRFICLAGFMKILSKKFIKKFSGKIVNIHPSLLPKYKGLNTHQKALKNNDKYSGCTVHYVTDKVDSGKIILQKKVKIKRKDSLNTLTKKVLLEEHKLYPRAISKVFKN
jgi:phosphoribosylglycinamide formyltransferase-1|tara:strand:+ start:336 stop:917 length:582 start_codon:yes stop_codon:yes gene_type:complete